MKRRLVEAGCLVALVGCGGASVTPTQPVAPPPRVERVETSVAVEPAPAAPPAPVAPPVAPAPAPAVVPSSTAAAPLPPPRATTIRLGEGELAAGDDAFEKGDLD